MTQLLRCSAALAIIAGAVMSQTTSHNVALLSTFAPIDTFSDIWGYAEPGTGREMALLTSRQGTYFVETTDPVHPVQRGYISAAASGWSPSTWRDARTFGHYAYIVTEGGGGMQIVDLAVFNSPQLVRTFRPAGINWSNTHNVSVDLKTGQLWALGTSGGAHVFDLNTNPTNPSYIGSYTAEYVHDLQSQDGVAYVSEINRGFLRLLDVRALPAMPQIGAVGLTAQHQAWPSWDDTFVASAQEAIGGVVTIFRTSTPGQLPQLSQYVFPANPLSSSVHNVFLRDRVLHCAWYNSGYAAADLSDPANPVTIGWYDASNGLSAFSGVWGCYPFQPSGNVYISDIQLGMAVLRPRSTPSHYGAATPGNHASELHTFGSGWLGNPTFGLELRDAAPSSAVFFFVGTAPLSLSAFGHTLLVDTTVGGIAQSSANAKGYARTFIPLPNDPVLDGVSIHAQCIVQDAGGPLGVASTDGLRFELFVR